MMFGRPLYVASCRGDRARAPFSRDNSGRAVSSNKRREGMSPLGKRDVGVGTFFGQHAEIITSWRLQQLTDRDGK